MESSRQSSLDQESKETNPDTLIKVFCDNKSVIARLTTIQTRKPSTMWSDYNLLQRCNKLLTRKFVFEHVQGHQDTISTNSNLTLQAKLNILIDKWAALAHSDPIILTEETTTGTIEINGKYLQADLRAPFGKRYWNIPHVHSRLVFICLG
jgi:hypothetical protein